MTSECTTIGRLYTPQQQSVHPAAFWQEMHKYLFFFLNIVYTYSPKFILALSNFKQPLNTVRKSILLCYVHYLLSFH